MRTSRDASLHSSGRQWAALFVLLLALLIAEPSVAQTADQYRQRAIELSRAKSWDEAVASYHKALDLEPNDALTHYNLALALKYKGDTRQAIDEFETTLQLKPKWAEAHYGLSAAWYDLHDLANALKELRAAIELDPKNVAAHRLAARVYSEQSDPLSADRELRRALESKPSAEIHFELGLVQGQLSNLDQAAAEFRQVLRLNPRFPSAHRLLGVALRRQGNHAGALAQFRRAVDIDPNDPEAQCDLGMELKAGGDTAAAIAAFQRAIALKPDFEKAHYNLGIALQKQGQSDAGKKELDQLNALQDFRAHLAQSKLLILNGVEALKHQKFDDALPLFQKAADQSPELPTSYYYLGVTYERKDDPARAIAAYQKALELKPDYSQVHGDVRS